MTEQGRYCTLLPHSAQLRALSLASTSQIISHFFGVAAVSTAFKVSAVQNLQLVYIGNYLQSLLDSRSDSALISGGSCIAPCQ